MRAVLFNNVATVPAASGTTDFPSAVGNATIAAFNADDFAAGTLDLSTSVHDQQGGNIKRVVFVQGRTGGDAVQLPAIDVDSVRNVKNAPYVAPTAQVTTIVPATGGAGVATIRVVRTDTGYKPDQRISAEIKVDGLTREQLCDAFVVALNKKAGKFYTASKTGSSPNFNIAITADLGVSFQTSLDDAATLWTKSTVAPNFGNGTEAMLSELEEQAWGANVTNRIYLPILPDRYASGNYDLFTFQAPTNTTAEISKSNMFMDITLAVRSTAVGINLEDFFGPGAVPEHTHA